MRKLQHGRNRSDRGFAIVMVLFVIGLLLVLGAALTMTSVMNSQNTVSADARERAYNTAESGIADVMTQLGNGTITASTNGWVTGNSFPSQNDSNLSYDYQVQLNSSTALPIAAQDPLTNTGQTCSSLGNSPGPGCVVIPANGAFIAVKGHYLGHTENAEIVAIQNDLDLNGYTLLTKGNAGTNGNGNIASDPCLATGGCGGVGTPTIHNVKAFTDGSFNGGKGVIDGIVKSVGTATATLPSGCTWCVAQSGASAIQFPSSNSLVQDENQWKNDAINQGHYISSSGSLPNNIDITSGSTWFIDQGIDLKSLKISNEGGILVVTGAVKETGNQADSNYTLSDGCDASCTCRAQAQMIGLATDGIALHGEGTANGQLQSQGVIFAPNGPATNVGNASMQAAVVANSAQIGGAGSMTADTCAAQAHINIPGYNIRGYGEY